MKKFAFASSFIVVFILTVFWGCKDSVTGAQIDSVVIPNSNVSYSKYIQPVLNVKCINCHGVSSTDGGVNLTSWSNTTADANVVFPGYPDNSSLVNVIQGRAGFPPMPPLGSPYASMNANQVQGVRTWIKEGAKNN